MSHNIASDVETLPFVGRKLIKEIFVSRLNSSSSVWRKALVFWGVGGSGKTAIRDELAKKRIKGELDGLQIPYGVSEVEAREFAGLNVHTPLIAFAGDLRKFGVRFPNFERYIKAYGGDLHTPLAISETDKRLTASFSLALFIAATTFSYRHQPVYASICFGIGALVAFSSPFLLWLAKKISWIESLERFFGGSLESEKTRKKRKASNGKNEGLLKAFFDDLDVYFRKVDKINRLKNYVRKLMGKQKVISHPCRLVLFLDSTHYDEKKVQRTEGGVPNFLHALAEECNRKSILLVLFVRDEMHRQTTLNEKQKNRFEEFEVQGLTPDEAREYLHYTNVRYDVHDSIIQCCNQEERKIGVVGQLCHPETLKWCRHIAKSESKEFFQSLHQDLTENLPAELIQRFLWLLPDKEIETWLKHLTLTPQFDRGAAMLVATHLFGYNNEKGFETLLSTSLLSTVLNSAPIRYRINGILRSLSRAEVKELHKKHWVEIHQKLHGYWRGKDERLAFYHQWWNEPETALKDWQNKFNLALKKRQFILAQDYLNYWSEFDLDGEDKFLLDNKIAILKAHFVLGSAFKTMASSGVPWMEVHPATYYQLSIKHFEVILKESSVKDKSGMWAIANCRMSEVYRRLLSETYDKKSRKALQGKIEVFAKNALGFYKSAVFNQLDWPFVPDEGKNRIIADLQQRLGVILTDLMKYEEAIENIESALRYFNAKDFAENFSVTSKTLIALYINLSATTEDKNTSFDYAEKAVSLSESSLDKDLGSTDMVIGRAYFQLARVTEEVELSMQRCEVALSYFRNSISKITNHGFRIESHQRAELSYNMGMSYLYMGKYKASCNAEARKYLYEAEKEFRSIGDLDDASDAAENRLIAEGRMRN